jgi:hypothetical protein
VSLAQATHSTSALSLKGANAACARTSTTAAI